MKKRIKRLITAAILLIAAGLLYFGLNRIFGFAIPCVFHKITGFYCPGCGVTGMLTDLLQFDFLGAFEHNQVLFVSLPIIIYLLVKLCIGYIKNGSLVLGKVDNCIVYVLIAVLVIFGILRNIPCFSYLQPY